jgi:hypothetical protein
LTVKVPTLVAVPAPVLTLIFPVVAPAGTMALSLVGESTVTLLDRVPLKVTPGAPVKLAPLTITIVPITPLDGVKLVIRGATRKLAALVAVPPGVVTAIGPLVAPAGTIAVIWPAESTVKPACLPLNFTAVAPVKLVPLTTTAVPTPRSGETPVIVGATCTVSAFALVAKPPPFTTTMEPLVALSGTIAVILVAELTLEVAGEEPLKVTSNAPVKLTPWMTTLRPTAALDGVKLVIRGLTV